MNGLVILIPVALGLGLLGLAVFFWALSHGQFDDMDGAALRIFLDDPDDPSQAEQAEQAEQDNESPPKKADSKD